jgi:hypothetical protein
MHFSIILLILSILHHINVIVIKTKIELYIYIYINVYQI